MFEVPKKVLIFAAHQDDETIGCAGTIRKWSFAGSEIDVCFMTDGATGLEQGTDDGNLEATRDAEALRVAMILGISKVHNLRLPCQRISNKQANFHKVIAKIREVKPDLVITHNPVCKHRDHKRTSALVEEACWKASENILEELGETHNVKDLWSFEILDPHPNPDIVVDITDTYEWKEAAMAEYCSQLGILNKIMSFIDGLTRVRGYSIGVERGEGFTRMGRVPVKL